MGICVIVAGPSGSGKSTSMRNFEAHEIGVLNVMNKPLPFRSKMDGTDVFDTDDYKTIIGCILSGKRNAWVVDDAGYLMSNELFARSQENGYGKFTDIAKAYQELILAAVKAPKDTITYIMMHVEPDAVGNQKLKTVGKMIDEKFCIEGAAPVVLESAFINERYAFVTNYDGHNLAKSPMGMFDPIIDNDLKAADAAMREYWNLAPLTAKEGK